MDWNFYLEEIDATAANLVQYLQTAERRVIALHGNMGAGKTTLTAAILKVLGGTDTVGSPTFSIINQYMDGQGRPFFHMDWYRLRDEEEALNAGVEDPLYSGAWCLVEWPEKARALLPEHTIHLYLRAEENGKRILSTHPFPEISRT